MQLNVSERINLLNILPQENDFVTLKIIRKLKDELSFSEEEIKLLNITSNEGRIKWRVDKSFEKEIEIGEKLTDIIVLELKKLNDSKKLHVTYMSLYEKFIEKPLK